MSSATAPAPARSVNRRLILLAVVLSVLAGIGVWQWRTSAAAREQLNLGRAALLRDDPAEARRHLELCLAAWPENGEANFLAARAARRDGDQAAAKKYLDEAERRGQPPADVELERALARGQAGDVDGAESILRKHLDGAGAAEAIAFLVPIYLAQFRIAEASGLTARWVELRPDSAKAWGHRADSLERLRNRTEAIDAYRRLVSLAPDDRKARLNLARMLIDNRLPPDEAAGHLESVLAADPENAAALVQLSACREAQGRPDDAVALLDRAIAGPKCDAAALHARGRLELQRGRPAVAVGFLRRGIGLDPSDVGLLYTLYLCLQQTGTPGEIRDAEERWRRCDTDLKRVGELSRLIAVSPKDPEPRREIGELFLRHRRTADGVHWLESALELDPRHAPTHRLLAAHYAGAGRPDLARKHTALAGDAVK